MPAKIYKVTLTTEERAELMAIVKKGKGLASRLKRANILLMADENQENGGWRDADRRVGNKRATNAHMINARLIASLKTTLVSQAKAAS